MHSIRTAFARGVATLAFGAMVTAPLAAHAYSPMHARSAVKHVLLINIDGMHDVDLERFVALHPQSTLARLAARGTTYCNAHAPVPTDSFPWSDYNPEAIEPAAASTPRR